MVEEARSRLNQNLVAAEVIRRSRSPTERRASTKTRNCYSGIQSRTSQRSEGGHSVSDTGIVGELGDAGGDAKCGSYFKDFPSPKNFWGKHVRTLYGAKLQFLATAKLSLDVGASRDQGFVAE